MFPSRDKFHFQITPSDRQLWAIGMVAVTWSHLETFLQLTAHAVVNNQSGEKDRYDTIHSFKMRLNALEAMIEAKMLPTWRDRFLNLIVEIRNAQLLRDRIIHGTWGGDGHPVTDDDTRGAFNWLKPRQPFDWKLDFGTIKMVATRIDDIAYRWQLTIIEGETGSNILMSEALRRKLRAD